MPGRNEVADFVKRARPLTSKWGEADLRMAEHPLMFLPSCRVKDDDYEAHLVGDGPDSPWIKAHHDEEVQKRKQAKQVQEAK